MDTRGDTFGPCHEETPAQTVFPFQATVLCLERRQPPRFLVRRKLCTGHKWTLFLIFQKGDSQRSDSMQKLPMARLRAVGEMNLSSHSRFWWKTHLSFTPHSPYLSPKNTRPSSSRTRQPRRTDQSPNRYQSLFQFYVQHVISNVLVAQVSTTWHNFVPPLNYLVFSLFSREVDMNSHNGLSSLVCKASILTESERKLNLPSWGSGINTNSSTFSYSVVDCMLPSAI